MLAELASAYELRSGNPVALQAMGGVEVARRIREGEPFDAVVLASETIDELLKGCRTLLAGSKVDLVRSAVAMAVRAGAPRPDIDNEDALRRCVSAARSIGCSTGPSGVRLTALFQGWGLAEALRERIVVAPPGVPVGNLVANGDVEIGFQQLSELIHIDGIDVVGPLPAPVQITTTFSAALGSLSQAAAQALLAFMASPDATEAKRRQGMQPVLARNEVES